jgi:hypothetical protein
MHYGQMLFDASIIRSHQSWEVDTLEQTLIVRNKIESLIEQSGQIGLSINKGLK